MFEIQFTKPLLHWQKNPNILTSIWLLPSVEKGTIKRTLGLTLKRHTSSSAFIEIAQCWSDAEIRERFLSTLRIR